MLVNKPLDINNYDFNLFEYLNKNNSSATIIYFIKIIRTKSLFKLN